MREIVGKFLVDVTLALIRINEQPAVDASTAGCLESNNKKEKNNEKT